MIVAKDLMTAKPIVLESSTSIKEAAELFIEKKITSVPVKTTMGEFSGQLTEMGLVRALVLSQLQPEKYRQIAHCMDLLEAPHFVSPDDPVATVIKTMLKSPSRRVLVRGDGSGLLGIISPKDLLSKLISGDKDAKEVRDAIEKLKT